MTTEDKIVKKEQKPRLSTLKRLLAFAVPEYGRIGLGLIALAVNSVTNLSFPWLIGKALDQAEWESLYTLVAKSGGFFLAGALASWLRVYCLGTATERIANRLRLELFDNILEQEMEYYESTQVGEIISLLEHDIQSAAEILTEKTGAGLRSLNSAVNGSYLLFSTSPALCGVALSTVPLVGIGAMSLSRYSRQITESLRTLQSKILSYSVERIKCISTVRLNNREEYEHKKFSTLLKESDALSHRRHHAYGLFMSFINLATNCSLVAVLRYGGFLISQGEMTVGTLTSFAIQSAFVGLGFSGLSTFYSDYVKAVDAATRVFKVIDSGHEQRQLPLTPATKTIPATSDHRPLITYTLPTPQSITHPVDITLEHVSFAYKQRPDQLVLSDINMHIPAHQITCIVGKSGVGKSTLGALLCGLYTPTEGAIMYGKDVMSLPTGTSVGAHTTPSHAVSSTNATAGHSIAHELFTLFGVVEQSSTTLLSGSISENIEYGKMGANQDEIEHAATLAHAHDFIMEFPDQYQTQVGAGGGMVSGGQQARIALARALIKKPVFLLLDEPTSALDNSSEQELISPLLKLKETTSIIIFTHSEGLKKIADVLYEIKDGVITLIK